MGNYFGSFTYEIENNTQDCPKTFGDDLKHIFSVISDLSEEVYYYKKTTECTIKTLLTPIHVQHSLHFSFSFSPSRRLNLHMW